MNDIHKKTEARFQGEWRWLLMPMIALLVISCSSPPPDTRVDSVQVTLQMASDVNPNANGKASPVRVTLYQLALSDEFLASDYLSLSEGKDVELNAQAHKSYDVIMVPGEKKEITLSVNHDITAIGVVTAYRNIAEAQWKAFYIISQKPLVRWYRKIWPDSEVWRPKMMVRMEHLTTSIKKMD